MNNIGEANMTGGLSKNAQGAVTHLTMLVALVLVAALGAGCSYSNAPKPSNHLFTEQIKLQAAEHWQLLARDMATRAAGAMKSDADAMGGALYVEPRLDTDFQQSFYDFLTAELTRLDLTVLTMPAADAPTLSYATQLVRHNSPTVGTATRLDAQNKYDRLENDELVVSVSLHLGDAILAKTAVARYIVDRDSGLYVAAKKAPAAAPKTKMKTYSVAE